MASCPPVSKHIRWCASLLNGARGRGFSTQGLEGTAVGEVLAALQPHINDAGKPLLSILTKSLEQDKETRVLLFELLEKERELRALGCIELFKARGLNDTRGLFQWLQEILAGKANIASGLKGTALREAILKVNTGLGACIQKCTNVSASNVVKQALHCYNVFSILSQYVHDGKSLAALQVAPGGIMKFERGPLSPEHVQVLLCIGQAAKVALHENTES